MKRNIFEDNDNRELRRYYETRIVKVHLLEKVKGISEDENNLGELIN